MLWKKIAALVAIVPTALSKPLFIVPGSDLNEVRDQLTSRQLGGSQNAAGQGKYTVVSGDSAGSIAAGFSITTQALSAANSGTNINALSAGQVINTPSSRLASKYRIASGDTQSSIASKYNVFGTDLATANPSINFNSPPVGQFINVPGYGRSKTWTVYSGDTGNGIALAFQITFSDLNNANPNTDWNNLQVGQVLIVPAAVSPTTGTLPPSSSTTTTTTTTLVVTTTTTTVSITSPVTTTTTTSRALTTTTSATCRTAGVSCIGNSQCCPGLSCYVGSAGTAACNTPRTTTTTTLATSTTTRSTTTTTRPTTTTTTTRSTTTTTRSTTTTTTTRSTTTTLATPSVTGPLAVTPVNDNDGTATPRPQYTFYQGDGSPARGWPTASQWISYSAMTNLVKNIIGTSCQQQWGVANNLPGETAQVFSSIQEIARRSNVDHRYILAVVMQESGGCVRAPTTQYGQVNPGLMQSFNGRGTCNTGNVTNPGIVTNPCPASTIYQMIVDGTMGTLTKTPYYAVGLVQGIQAQSGQYALAQAYYRGNRIYNAGSIPANNDLGAPGATRCYVSDIANRLTGWTQAPGYPRTCTLDNR